MILTIARREFGGFALTPFGPVLLAFCQLLLAYLFLSYVDSFLGRQAELAALPNSPGATQWVVTQWLAIASIVLLAALPLITMKSFSDEWRGGTMSLLLSAPASSLQIVLGKFIGILAVIGLIVATAALMPISLHLGTTADFGLIAAAMLGLFLLLMAFAAIGLYMSSLTRQPSTAAFSTFGVLLLLWLLEWTVTDDITGSRAVFAYVSLFRHFQPFIQGQMVVADVMYFVLVCALFLGLTVRRLEAQRRFD